MNFCRGAVIFFLLASAIASAGSRHTKKEDPSSVSSGSYVGADVCIACHDDADKSIATTAHRRLSDEKEPARNGCEACHGPGSEHVDSNGSPEKIFAFQGRKASDIRTRCTVCHASLGANHGHSKLSCLSCHSAHHASEAKAILVKPAPDLCTDCHR